MDALITPHLVTDEDLALEAERCRAMWNDVVALAWSDFAGETVCTVQEREDARRFCLARTGEWAASRDLACSLAGLDPDSLREAAELHNAKRSGR